MLEEPEGLRNPRREGGSSSPAGGRGPARRRLQRRLFPLVLLLVVTAHHGAGSTRAADSQDGRAEIPSGSHLDAVAATAIASQQASPANPSSDNSAVDQAPASDLYFSDVTAQAGIDFHYTFGDYAYDNILESSGSGVTWIDHDGDGDLDLYLLNGVYIEGTSDPKGRTELSDATNRFYCNLGQGRFEDCTARSGLDDGVWSMAAVAGDVNDDGFVDLFVANYGPNRLFLNRGDGSFVDVAAPTGLTGPELLNGFVKWSVGGAWFDADRDGDLDLSVCNFLAFDINLLVPGREWEMPDPKEYRGQTSQLYLQQNNGTFSEVTEEAGLLHPESKCMGMMVFDIDEDGRLDILQTNDHQPNFLFKREADGTYTEIGTEVGLAVNDQGLGTGSMHGTPGDINGDSLIDFLVVDLRHGSLYTATPDGLFTDTTWSSGVGALLDGLDQWGAGLVDFDLDADLDLFTTNGVAHILVEQLPALATNDGGGHFLDARAGAGSYLRTRRSGRGAAFADFDNDGDVDIVINHVDHRASTALLRNDTTRRGHWLELSLVGRSPRTAHGARVDLTAGDTGLVRILQPAASYLSGSDPRLHFGTGRAVSAHAARITWPSGSRQLFKSLPADHSYTVYEAGRSAPASP